MLFYTLFCFGAKFEVFFFFFLLNQKGYNGYIINGRSKVGDISRFGTERLSDLKKGDHHNINLLGPNSPTSLTDRYGLTAYV